MINIYKKHTALHFFYLTFILNFSIIFPYSCNDNSALNYNPNSDFATECVYFDIPSFQQTDEDIPFEVDLLSFSSGYQTSNLLFTLDCSNISYIESCLLIDNQLTIIFSDNYDSISETLSLIVNYDDILVTDTFYVSVNPINDNPVILANDGLQASVGNQFEYVIDVSDVDNNLFNFSLIDNPFGVDLISHSSIAIISYIPSELDPFIDCFENSQCFDFTIQVSDFGTPVLSTQESFLIKIVNSDNSLPVITLLDTQNHNEDETITVNFNVSDDDSMQIIDLTFLCIYSRQGSTNNQYHQVSSGGDISDYKATFQPFNNWNGDFEIKIIADDQISFVTYSFILTISPVNDNPIISNYQNISFNEGEYDNLNPFNQNIYLIDSDQNIFANENPFSFADITYTLRWYGSSVNGNDSNENQHIFSEFIRSGSSNVVINNFFAQDNNWYGTEYFEITINDGESGDITTVFPVTINNINDPPELIDIVDEFIDEDTEIIITIDVNDIDSENLFYTMTGPHVNYVFDANVLTINPDDHYNGDLDLSVNVSDGNLSVQDSFILSISPINDSPYTEDLTSILLEDDINHLIDINGTIANDLCRSEISNNSGNSIFCNCDELQEGACDIEDVNLSFKLNSNVLNGNLYLNTDSNSLVNIDDTLFDSTIYYTPDSNFFGLDEFTYEVCDQELLCSIGTIKLVINELNDTPVINEELISIITNEDTSSSINLIASDIDGDNLTYTITDIPLNGLLYTDINSLNEINLNYELDGFILYYNPNLNFNGLDSFSFSVSDGFSTADAIYSINILPVNDAPVATEAISSVTDEDQSVVVTLLGSDIDGDNLTFSLNGDAINGSISLDASFATYTPNANYSGSDSFTFTVSDGLETAEAVVTINISAVNDAPVLATVSDVIFDEDESGSASLSASDVDGDDLTYSISEGTDIIVTLTGLDIAFSAPDNFNGSETFTVSASDGEYTDLQIITVFVSAVNDNPIANDIVDSIEAEEDTPIEISISGSDIEYDILYFNIASLPINGIIANSEGVILDINSTIAVIENSNINLYQTTLVYTPNLNFIGSDSFSFIISDMSENNSLSNIVKINLLINQVNDAPVLNCPNDNCNLLLSEIVTIYEDCSLQEAEDNQSCNNLDSIIIEQLRLFNDSSNDICSNEHLWYDTDCNISDDVNDFDFGIAIDMATAIDDIENNRGIWQYKEKNGSSYNDLNQSLSATCNFKLLDHDDQIRFIPLDNYHTTENIETFPSIIFSAWDKTQYNDESCVSSLENSTSFSLGTYTAQFEIISINDSPVSDVIELGSALKEHCPINDNPLCGQQIIEIPINFDDSFDSFGPNGEVYSDNMFYYISSKTLSNNNQQSMFKNIEFSENFYNVANLVNLDVNDILEQKEDGLYLKLDLMQYVNGTAEVTVVAFDRENFSESLSTEQVFTVEIEQVNNKINEFQIIHNIGFYENYDDNIINNDAMIHPYNFAPEDDLYIKYPPYEYNNSIITVSDINRDNFYSIREYMKDNPYEMDEIYFMWNRNLDSYLDHDIDQMLNDEPYDLYYRLEFLDQNNNIYVLKDSILENFTNLENAYTKVKLSKGPYKKYINGDIYNPQSFPSALIDTTGLTFYNWRIVADNYSTPYEDIIPGFDFYNTNTLYSDRSYAINLNIPKLNYDFVLNDIYTNYYDLYLSPIPTNFTGINNYENIIFNQNSEMYVWNTSPNSGSDNLFSNEVVNIEEIYLNNNLLNQSVYLAYDDLNSFGYYRFYSPIENDVGNINIYRQTLIFEQVIPNVYSQIESLSGNFNIEFMPHSNFNILFYEKASDEIIFNHTNLDFASNIYILKGDNAHASEMKINYNLDSNLENLNSLSFAIYEDGNIYKINSEINNGILSADIEEFGSFIIISDNNILDNDTPNETSILSCFPNPFNPTTKINYFLEKDADIEFQIFNIAGQSIYNSNIISSKEGNNIFSWNALDDFGNKIPSGIYIVSMNLGDKVYSQKITFLK